MNVIVNTTESNTSILQLPEETESLIKASIAENTLKAYQRALQSLTAWLAGRTLSDALLANYITALHETGKSPATIGQVVAAVKWQLKNQSNATHPADAHHTSNISRYSQERQRQRAWTGRRSNLAGR